MRKAKAAAKSLTALPALTEVAAPVKAQMGSFLDGTDGAPRMTWARSYSPCGYGWNSSSGSLYPVQGGGRTAREATLASAIAIDLVTKNPTLMTIVETAVANTLGPAGLTLSSKPVASLLGMATADARKLSTAIEVAYNAWANNPRECDYAGRNDLHALAAVFLRHCILSGEGLAIIDWQRCRDAKTRTKVSLLDPRQLEWSQTRLTPQGDAVQGVVFRNGRLVGYMIQEAPLGAFTYAPMARFVPAATPWGKTIVLHVFEQVDARQLRGLSPLVAALTPANERETVTEFAIAGLLIQNSYAATIQSDLPPAVALDGLDSGGHSRNAIGELLSAKEAFYGQTKIELSPGIINHLPPGDKLVMNKAPNSGAAIAPFMDSLTRSAARAAGCMVEEISGDYSKTSFSASRLAQELPYRITLRRRRIFVERFYNEVFKAWLDEAVDTGTIVLPKGAPDYFENRDAYSNAMWRGIGRAEPDRKKAAEATALELELGLTTMEAALAERGIDMDAHFESLEAELPMIKKAGLDKPRYAGATTTQNRDERIAEVDPKKLEDDDDV